MKPDLELGNKKTVTRKSLHAPCVIKSRVSGEIMTALRAHQPTTGPELVKAVRRSRSAVFKALRKLRSRGVVERRVMDRPPAWWLLSEEGVRAAAPPPPRGKKLSRRAA